MTDGKWIELIAKYATTCRRCYKRVHVGQEIEFHTVHRTVRHVGCEKGNYLTYGGKGRKVA